MTSNIVRTPSRPSPQATYLPSVGPEVWLYDQRHLSVLLESGVLDPHDPLAATKYKALGKQGLVVGYGLPACQHVTRGTGRADRSFSWVDGERARTRAVASA